MKREFPGNPTFYKRFAIYSTIGLYIWLFGGLVLIQYFWAGKTWLLGWKPVIFSILFALWYGRTAYKWMMRLDAQYGKGSAWILESTQVKLPQRRS